MRAGVVARALVAAAVCAVTFGSAGTTAVADAPTGVYVSTSGVPHVDVGDYRQAAHWRPGMPTGINGAWQRAIDNVIGQIAAEKPDAVFHTGDMVQGRWGIDPEGSGLFGPVKTLRQRRRAVRRAGDLYYSQMKARWAAHGLYPHFGVGDHEVGDIGPDGVVGPATLRYRALDAWRTTWARNFTDGGNRYAQRPRAGQHRGTAYAARLGAVGLVTLDPIERDGSGISARISRQQLRWLRRAVADLRSRGVRWVFVQTEIPARGPNRAVASSELMLDNGRQLWRTLKELDVDLLLSGEFHRMTAHSNGGRTPVQVVHGGSLRRGKVNYLVITTFADRVELQLKRMRAQVHGTSTLWAPSRHRAPRHVTVSPRTKQVGKLTIHADGSLSRRSGYLREGL